MTNPTAQARIEKRLRELDHRLRIHFDWAEGHWVVQEVGSQSGRLHHVLNWSGPVDPAEPLLQHLRSIDWSWTNCTASDSNVAVINESMGDPEMAAKVQTVARLKQARDEGLEWLRYVTENRVASGPGRKNAVGQMRRALREGRLMRDKIRRPKELVIPT